MEKDLIPCVDTTDIRIQGGLGALRLRRNGDIVPATVPALQHTGKLIGKMRRQSFFRHYKEMDLGSVFPYHIPFRTLLSLREDNAAKTEKQDTA